MRRWPWSPVLMVLMAVGLILGCRPAPKPAVAPPDKAPVAAPAPAPVAQPKKGGTLRWVPYASVKSLDPIWTTAYVTRDFGYAVYDVLFAWDSKGTVKPQMVKSWSASPDGLTYTFTLREGLTFHDGRPVTSEDVIASLSRWGKKDGLGRLLFGSVERLEKVDDATFRLVLKAPFGLVLEALGKPSSNLPVIMPKEQAATSPDESVRTNIGSGPFRFVAFEPGHRWVAERYDAYKPRPEPADGVAGGKVVYIDRLETLEVPDVATRIAGLETGTYDFLDTFSHDHVARLRANPKIDIFISRPGNILMLRFNHTQPPFNHVKARQAVQAAFKKGDHLRAAVGPEEFWLACPAIFACGGLWETRASAEFHMEGNTDKAKALLREAGYKGEPVVILSPTDLPILHNPSLVTKKVLEDLGMTVDFKAVDWATVVSLRAKREGWNIFHTWWIYPDIYDPAIYAALGPVWFGWYTSPRMEDLRKKFALATTKEERKGIVDQVQHLFYEEVPFVHLGQFYDVRASQKYVKGYLNFPAPVFWGVWLDR